MSSEQAIYSNFYRALNEIRDLFHKSGRFDDSNSKLDEIVKLISIYLYQLKHSGNSDVDLHNLISQYKYSRQFDIVLGLKETFNNIVLDQDFLNEDGTSIFGSNPQLAIQNSDGDFAYRLLLLVVNSIDDALSTNSNGNRFDLLNEAFGHFVRDNFRNHIEDAQYMTPPEVVEFMCQIALNDLAPNIGNKKSLKVVDPSCGVGSFLSTFYRLARYQKEFADTRIEIFGQDKVDRMVRLSRINMMLFNTENHKITYGNSLIGDSPLNYLDGTVDLILTNPPFGAKFSSIEIYHQFSIRYPLLYDLARTSGRNFPSELLFLDRCMALLKPGGKLLAIVPDSVISAKGMSATFRQRLGRYGIIRLIVELPTVTFAQAGTRTKTHILYVEKRKELYKTEKRPPVFMGLSTHIGFEVKSRKGTPVKVKAGKNDLPLILESYVKECHITGEEDFTYKVVKFEPSCVLLEFHQVLNGSWTPNHYHSTRYKAISTLSNSTNSDIDLIPLEDAVDFLSSSRRREVASAGSKCISVLHIMNEGVINFSDLSAYEPKHPGINCRPGELLFSRINPRIPRATIVPKLDFPLTCSTEFEIMNSKIYIDNYAIMMLLLSPLVQQQIQFLTSGTSSSHNRIKTKELKKVVLPVPKLNTPSFVKFSKVVDEFSCYVKLLNETHLKLVTLKPELDKAFFAS